MQPTPNRQTKLARSNKGCYRLTFSSGVAGDHSRKPCINIQQMDRKMTKVFLPPPRQKYFCFSSVRYLVISVLPSTILDKSPGLFWQWFQMITFWALWFKGPGQKIISKIKVNSQLLAFNKISNNPISAQTQPVCF